MGKSHVDKMRARARDVRGRAGVRRWNDRQRNLAAGVWYRLRRVLADAKTAYVISEDDARRLIAEGYQAESCGNELSPEKTILFVDDVRLATLESRRPIPVRLDADFIRARAIALVAFDDVRGKSESDSDASLKQIAGKGKLKKFFP